MKSNYIKNFLTIFLSVLITLLIVEIFLRFFLVPSSSGINIGILNNKFSKLNYKLDENGFRNEKITPKADYVFLGDSFTFGNGLKVEKTFPQIVKKRLLNKNIYNLGIGGTNTIDQLKILKSYDLKKNSTVVYQYFFNDIDYNKKYISSKSVENDYLLRNLKKFIFFSINNSYTFDFFIHPFLAKILKLSNALTYDEIDYLEHLNDVKLIFDYLNKKNVNVIFILIPILQSKETIDLSSKTYINFFEKNFFKICNKKDVLINISKFLDHYDSKDLIVSKRDTHASYSVNKIIADKIHELIFNKYSSNQFIKCS
jgi:hypothetical protein